VDREFAGTADHERHRDVVNRHCEERSDEAIHARAPEVWIASLRSQ
jgi:hypothetical protein